MGPYRAMQDMELTFGPTTRGANGWDIYIPFTFAPQAVTMTPSKFADHVIKKAKEVVPNSPYRQEFYVEFVTKDGDEITAREDIRRLPTSDLGGRGMVVIYG